MKPTEYFFLFMFSLFLFIYFLSGKPKYFFIQFKTVEYKPHGGKGFHLVCSPFIPRMVPGTE